MSHFLPRKEESFRLPCLRNSALNSGVNAGTDEV